MKTPRTLAVAACLVGICGTTGFAQHQADSPYRPSHSLHQDRPNTARLITPAERHPDVAVPRDLAAQPVHPWLAEVLLNEAITTYVDPLRTLTGDRGLDESHSLVRAQRLHRQLMGITTSQLAELSNRSLASRSRPALGNRAKLIRPTHRRQAETEHVRPILIYPAPAAEPAPDKPQPRPIPSVPRMEQGPPRQMAQAGND